MNNNTYLLYTISLPPAFFPTHFCRGFFKAKEKNIPEFPQDMNINLGSVLIPIVAKLLSIPSRKILDRLLTLLEMFKKAPLASASPSAETLQQSPPKKTGRKIEYCFELFFDIPSCLISRLLKTLLLIQSRKSSKATSNTNKLKCWEFQLMNCSHTTLRQI